MDDLTLMSIAVVSAAAFLAGAIKGAVGFAMPMVMMSALAILFDPKIALALLIFPTMASNLSQSLRQGYAPARDAVKEFAPFMVVGGLCLIATAHLVTALPTDTMILVIGVFVVCFAAFQLSGWQFKLSGPSKMSQSLFGFVAGSVGGLSGIWGPPTVAYLTAINTPKVKQMHVQGVIYGLGSVALLVGHIGSGLVTMQTVPLSVALILPALLGITLGYKVSDRVDQASFRKMTLIVLLVSGFNLIRRGLMG
ncbi:sulfite exporter TauE/SafE family protein [Cognatiyoonia sp.]|uniref:sulfite exporter TauE/SafE family protein n=1 Tax=Cognatiyoonia sp. TaxID=2211652 RepID=UPI003F69ACFA